MQVTGNLSGHDYGMFVLAGFILAKNPGAHLNFFYKVGCPTDVSVLKESDLWDQYLPEDDQAVGIMFDHARHDIATWAGSKGALFPVQALSHLANEGLSDTVEFRRIARRFIRRAKQNHCQVLFFPEAIFSEPKTAKILQHLAGTQLKIQTLSLSTDDVSAEKNRQIKVYHSLSDVSFLKARAESLLRTKLKDSDFEKVEATS